MINVLIKEFNESLFFSFRGGSFCSPIECNSRAHGQYQTEFDICICVINELTLCIITHRFPVKHYIHSTFKMIKFPKRKLQHSIERRRA